MKWTGPKQGKLRKALIEIYGARGIKSLELFINDNFECSLAGINTDNPEDWATALIKQFVADGKLINELYQTLCQENSNHLAIKELLRDQSSRSTLLDSMTAPNVDVSALFNQFSPAHDFDTAYRAFLSAFDKTYNRPFQPKDGVPWTDLSPIRAFLEIDRPRLAVTFAGEIVEIFMAANSQYDASAIKEWQVQMATAHNIAIESQPAPQTTPKGYLLVSLKKDKASQDIPFFTVYLELFVTGESAPVEEFQAETRTCALNEIASHLSAEILKAEDALSKYGRGRVTIEFFLPYDHLEIDVANWDAFDKQGILLDYPFGKHRSFVIRSLDRAEGNALKAEVERKWMLLKDCVASNHNNACSHFHPQTTCPDPGDLQIDLEDMPGLKLSAELPQDRTDYEGILNNIIDSAVPIALWFSAAQGISESDRLTQFDLLLQGCECLTDFSALAKQWRILRKDPTHSAVVPHLRMLCDCPDRWPLKPFPQAPLIPIS